MQTINKTIPPSNLDFSQPPPGYSGHETSSVKVKPGPSVPKIGYYEGLNRTRLAQPQNHTNVALSNRFPYYRSSDIEIAQGYIKARANVSANQQNVRPVYGDVCIANDPAMQYTLPPPPPPPAPSYQANMAGVTSGSQFFLNPGVYTTYPMPPLQMGGSIGAGQYVNQQQGNYHPHQHYQREFNTRYPTRGGYNNPINRKRKMPQETPEVYKRNARKKRKPLSNNIMVRKDWSVEDAKRALEVEKEANKRYRKQSLIVKFPDLELNRDIVSKFHPMIDSVHFQMPSSPRFCFVSLKDDANLEEVIKELNKVKFGYGYLTVEIKRDREEDIHIGPEDIDPLTLYVGNLSQEVTVEDVVKAYPKNKRIDIGFAKKMRFTRYAFVCFHTVDDSIEAFQSTHASEMYSKSLIVRFRRLHGTVGLPGEPKPQNFKKKGDDPNSTGDNASGYSDDFWKEDEYMYFTKILNLKQELDDDNSLSDEYDQEYSNYFDNLLPPAPVYQVNKYESGFDKENSESSSFNLSDDRNDKSDIKDDSRFKAVKVKLEPVEENNGSGELELEQSNGSSSEELPMPLLDIKIEKENDVPLPITEVKQEEKETDADKEDEEQQKESSEEEDSEEKYTEIGPLPKVERESEESDLEDTFFT